MAWILDAKPLQELLYASTEPEGTYIGQLLVLPKTLLARLGGVVAFIVIDVRFVQ